MWDLVYQRPVHSDLANHFQEFVEIHGFDDVTVDAEFIALDDIAFFLGGHQHHDRYRGRLLIRLEFPQNFDAIYFG